MLSFLFDVQEHRRVAAGCFTRGQLLRQQGFQAPSCVFVLLSSLACSSEAVAHLQDPQHLF